MTKKTRPIPKNNGLTPRLPYKEIKERAKEDKKEDYELPTKLYSR